MSKLFWSGQSPNLLEDYDPTRLRDAVTGTMAISGMPGAEATGRISRCELIDRFHACNCSIAPSPTTNAELWIWELEIVLRCGDELAGGRDAEGADTLERLEPDVSQTKLTIAIQSGSKDEEAKGLDAMNEALLMRPALFVQHTDAFPLVSCASQSRERPEPVQRPQAG